MVLLDNLDIHIEILNVGMLNILVVPFYILLSVVMAVCIVLLLLLLHHRCCCCYTFVAVVVRMVLDRNALDSRIGFHRNFDYFSPTMIVPIMETVVTIVVIPPLPPSKRWLHWNVVDCSMSAMHQWKRRHSYIHYHVPVNCYNDDIYVDAIHYTMTRKTVVSRAVVCI
jgi:hypothetical protein